MKIACWICLFVSSILPTFAKLEPLDPYVQRRQLALVEKLYSQKDEDGLISMLQKEHLFIKRDAALKLGRLNSEKALQILKTYDESFSNFACCESGQFGVAVILIENKTMTVQKKALLAVAMEPWTAGPHAQSVIDQAGRELSRFAGEDVLRALNDINTYGAQYTVLKLQCSKLPESEAISKCIGVLRTHETPQKAEAAEALLIAYGVKAAGAVAKLEKETSGTVQSRCTNILSQVKNQNNSTKSE